MTALAEPLEPPVDIAYGRPAAPLAGIVDRYIGYRMTGFAPGVHRGLPGRRLTFIISLDRPVESVPGAPAPAAVPSGSVPAGMAVTRHQAFVAGLHVEHAMVHHDGNQHGIAIELGPFASRPLFGLPAGELSGAIVSLDELLGRSVTSLADRLVHCSGWPQRFAVLDAVLLAAARDPVSAAPVALGEAWRRLLDVDGPHRVDEVASDLGWSRRHLGSLVRREVGLVPSQLRRVARFERSSQLLAAVAASTVPASGQPSPGSSDDRARPRLTLADIAAHCGYFDQAHLNRDWRALAGCSPLAWLAEEGLPIVRSRDGDDLLDGDWSGGAWTSP